MSDELFEVAFSGQINEGADLEQVKAKVGAMFKADATKLAHLFSGKRMVIKKNIDQATANKYKSALNNAGAVCEVKSLSEEPVKQAVEAKPAQASPTPEPTKPEAKKPEQRPATVTASGDVPAAPKTDPLGIGAGDIAELTAALAPVGSDMQDETREVAEPSLDLTGLDMAPAGSDLGQVKKDDAPPPPDTNGLSLVD